MAEYRKISEEILVNEDGTMLQLRPNGRDDIDYYVPVQHIAGIKFKPSNNTGKASHKIVIDVIGSEGAMILLYDDEREARRCAAALSGVIEKYYAS